MEEEKLMKQCKHAIGGKVNEIGEVLMFCELTDNLENVTLGECIGNCESQHNKYFLTKEAAEEALKGLDD